MSPNLTTKRCTKCGGEFPLIEEFWDKRKDSKDGFRGTCRECRLQSQREHRKNNADEIRSYHRNYRALHRNEQRLSRRLYREKYQQKERERHKIYRDNNKEKRKTYNKFYYQSHPETYRGNVNKRRAKIAQAEGSHTPDEINQLYKSQKGKCFHCEIELHRIYHCDHWIPLAKGGSNWISNIRLLCPYCNLSKHDKLPCEWDSRYCD